MQIKRLRREAARANTQYMKVHDRCLEVLKEKRFFKKDWILKDLGFEVFEFRWDYIAEWIAEDGDCELAPLAEAFFKRQAVREARLSLPGIDNESRRVKHEEVTEKVPGKFTAAGHGKKTVGYASVEYANGALHLKRLEMRDGIANGLKQSANKLRGQIMRAKSSLKIAG